MVRRGAITYDGLPISSGGAHTLRAKGFVSGLNTLQSFATALSLDYEPKDLVVEVVEGEGVNEFFRQLSDDFDTRFKKKMSRGIGSYTGHQWIVDRTELNSLIHQLEMLRPIPLAGYAGYAAVVHSDWNLVFFDSTGGPLPCQNTDDYQRYEVKKSVPIKLGHLGKSFVDLACGLPPFCVPGVMRVRVG
jgi:hypothetical protein